MDQFKKKMIKIINFMILFWNKVMIKFIWDLKYKKLQEAMIDSMNKLHLIHLNMMRVPV